MRTTVTIDDDVYEAARLRAELTGERFGKVLSELARRGLQPPPEARRRAGTWPPTVDVPPGTPPISVEKVQEFLDEEGYI